MSRSDVPDWQRQHAQRLRRGLTRAKRELWHALDNGAGVDDPDAMLAASRSLGDLSALFDYFTERQNLE